GSTRGCPSALRRTGRACPRRRRDGRRRPPRGRRPGGVREVLGTCVRTVPNTCSSCQGGTIPLRERLRLTRSLEFGLDKAKAARVSARTAFLPTRSDTCPQ